jgi:hypothetical protein
MINSVMINEEKVNKRSPLPPSLAHLTPLKVNYFDTRLWPKKENGELKWVHNCAVLCCRGSGCRSPPTTRARLVWRSPPPARSLARFVTETRQGPFYAWEAGCGVEGGAVLFRNFCL